MALPRVSGIYAIRHVTTGRIYVGSSLNIYKRAAAHRSLLKTGKHTSRALQAAWTKYGGEAFAFEVLEVVSERSELFAREQHWVDHFQAHKKGCGFNMRPEVGSNRRLANSPETRQKMRLKMLALFAAEPWRRDAMRARALGRKMTPEAIAKSANSRRGKKLSEQHRANLSKAHTGVRLNAKHKAAIVAGMPKVRSASFRAAVSTGIKRHWRARRAKQPEGQLKLL